MRKRVVITGMGAITPLGNSVRELFEAQLEGKSGVTAVEHFDASRFPTKFAAQVKNFDVGKLLGAEDRWTNAGLNTRFALPAAKQALENAGVYGNDRIDRTRIGVYLGAGEGTQDFPNMISSVKRSLPADSLKPDVAKFIIEGLKSFNRQSEYEQELHTPTGHVADYFDLQGPNFNCLTACAASSQAVGEATMIIRHGDADVMLAGGSHSMIHPLGMTGFNRLTALSEYDGDPTKASRPFDLNRNGFVLGEGAGMVVLEELEHAKKRNAPILAEITGYGSSADAFRMTDSHPEGRGAVACIKGALSDAGLASAQIDYINAHGTSTEVNDRVETLAIKKVFGEGAYQIPISSTKSTLGHLLAAAGAVELITCVEVIRRGIIAPTINYETPDPDCDLDYVPNRPREVRADHVLSNSFGFGGQNVSLTVSRFVD